jgi:ubiquinone/menaquinone biosynthesis C-methylase UbiE
MTEAVDPESNETRAIHELVDFHGKDVLEIGCGDGRMTWRYARLAANVLGVDPIDTDIAIARTTTPVELRSSVAFRAADAVSIDLDSASFDVVVFSRSI